MERKYHKEERRIDWDVEGLSMLDKFKRRIDWSKLSGREEETLMATENIERFKDYWDWKELSNNDALEWSIPLIELFIVIGIGKGFLLQIERNHAR